jgi:hypothetical protein
VAEAAGLYLAGAGIGSIALHGASNALRDQLVALNPDVIVTLADGRLGNVPADVLIACDAGLADIDNAAASRCPVVAGGVDGDRGWFVVCNGPDTCASCAARYGVRELAPALGWAGSGGREAAPPPPTPKRQQAAALQIGSLIALAVVKLRLGLGEPAGYWRFDGHESMLVERLPERFPGCPVCAAP